MLRRLVSSRKLFLSGAIHHPYSLSPPEAACLRSLRPCFVPSARYLCSGAAVRNTSIETGVVLPSDPMTSSSTPSPSSSSSSPANEETVSSLQSEDYSVSFVSENSVKETETIKVSLRGLLKQRRFDDVINLFTARIRSSKGKGKGKGNGKGIKEEEGATLMDSEDHNVVLSACAQAQPSAAASQAASIAYRFFLDSGAVPMGVFEKALRVCAKNSDAINAYRIYRSYSSRYTSDRNREKLLFPAISLIATHVLDTPTQDLEPDRLPLGVMFIELQRLVHAKRVPVPDVALLTLIVKAFSHLKQAGNLLQALQLLTAHYLPTLELCDFLLARALWSSDAKTLSLLIGWYINNFEQGLEIGQTNRVLQIASSQGDETLAKLGFKLLQMSGQTAELGHYVCWARACLLSSNLNGAIEALLEAQGQGLDVLNSAYGHSLQMLVADSFKISTSVLDGIYFALVDLRRGNYVVPPVVLNGLIIAAGKLSQLDRVFGTFQEYQSLFGLQPDIHTHNALLSAVSFSKFPDVEVMMTVFEDMERASIEPNNESFSILLTTMAETGKMKEFDDIMKYMRQLERKPSLRALRRVAVRLAKDKQQSRLEEVLKMIYDISGESEPPLFLLKRLKLIERGRHPPHHAPDSDAEQEEH